MKIRFSLAFLSVITLSLNALTPGKRAALSDLMKALEANISEQDARERAAKIGLIGSDYNDHRVIALMQLAESKSIQDIFNPARAPKKAIAQEPAQPTITTETIVDIAEPHNLFTLQYIAGFASVPLFIHEFIGRLNNYPYTEADATALRAKNMHSPITPNPYAGKTPDAIMQEVAPIIAKITNDQAEWDTQSIIETFYQLILARIALTNISYQSRLTQKIWTFLRKYHRQDAQSEPLYVAEIIENFERENRVDESNDREKRFKR